jgi:SAM-dependent methyltransferase
VNFFDEVYTGTPPWDIGRPQPELVRLSESGEVRGRVLDLGCGTGENALFFAAQGHDCVGVDFARRAIARAQEKAARRALGVRFLVRSALELGELGGPFDTVIDCGLFHTFLDPHRPVYAENVLRALRPGGRFFVLCFSELEPPDWGGPRRVSQHELRAIFAGPLEERWIRPARFDTNMSEVKGHAWLGAFERSAGERARGPHRRRRPTAPR